MTWCEAKNTPHSLCVSKYPKSMRRRIQDLWKLIERCTKTAWYLPLICVLAFIDLFIFVIPTDTLLISYTVLQPKKWIRAGLAFALSSAIGAVVMAVTIRLVDDFILDRMFQLGLHPSTWTRTSEFIETYGAWALGLHALGPLPLQPGVIVVALGKMSLTFIFISVFIGRAAKYLFFAWAGAYAPEWLEKFGLIKIKRPALQLVPNPHEHGPHAHGHTHSTPTQHK
jgi:membrane protein YqaA with SNARE-associated domain